MNSTRRDFLQHSMQLLVGAAGLATAPNLLAATSSRSAVIATTTKTSFARLLAAPKLYCTAYITPNAPTQGGQEQMVARYPLALVPQTNTTLFRDWRNRVRSYNNDIIFLGYQMVFEEVPTQPGPGNDVLRQSGDIWLRLPNGRYSFIKSGTRTLRLADTRKPKWQSAFLNACRAVLNSYPYDGLYLDNCTIYTKAHPSPLVRSELSSALQSTLLRLRTEFPDKIIVGNASDDWKGLNGENNEGRPRDATRELAPKVGQTPPWCNMYQSLLKSPTDTVTLNAEMTLAHSMGAFYSAAVDYQHVLWFPQFDNYLRSFKS